MTSALKEVTSVTNHKLELILAFIAVIETTSPALAVVFRKYLLPEDSERSQKLQATLQIETFSELLELWTKGIAPELLIQALPYFLEILKHHLTEKGTDDFLFFDEEGHIPLKEEITHYNSIAGDLARGLITIEEAISQAQMAVVTPKLQAHDTDLASLFNRLSAKPTMKKRFFMRMLDLRHSSRLKKATGEMGARRALRDPNTFIMVANLHEIAHARENILELDQKTNGRLEQIVEYALTMLAARYTGGNNLLENIHVPVEKAVEIGTDTVLIGFTYAMGLAARASADPEFLEAIENQQPIIIDAMTAAARLIREMNDASPTALSNWGESSEIALDELINLRHEVGFTLSPKEFFIQLKECAQTRPDMQRYVDCYARQVVDAVQGEYNIGLFAATDALLPNTWESFVHNMDVLSQDYVKTRKRLGEQLQQIDQRAADFIGMMVGYHVALYSFAKGDFDEEREIELTMRFALNWPVLLRENKEDQLSIFIQMLDEEKALSGETRKAHLLAGVLTTLRRE